MKENSNVGISIIYSRSWVLLFIASWIKSFNTWSNTFNVQKRCRTVSWAIVSNKSFLFFMKLISKDFIRSLISRCTTPCPSPYWYMHCAIRARFNTTPIKPWETWGLANWYSFIFFHALVIKFLIYSLSSFSEDLISTCNIELIWKQLHFLIHSEIKKNSINTLKKIFTNSHFYQYENERCK